MISLTDERPHVPGRDPLWEESWYFDFVASDGSLGGYVRLAVVPRDGTAWFWAAVAGRGRPLVTLRDHDVAPPRGRSLEARASGLWVDLVCETPLDHWSVGLEAFGVALDDAAEAWLGERGDRTALGLDLEWEAVSPGEEPVPATSPSAGPGGGGYGQVCAVHGDVLVGRERIALDGSGARSHAWGRRDWWGDPWRWASATLDDGTGFARFFPAGAPRTGDGDVPASDVLPFDGDELAVSVLAPAPVLVPAGGGRAPSRLARALCRFESAGRGGYGWAEWLHPGGSPRAAPPSRG